MRLTRNINSLKINRNKIIGFFGIGIFIYKVISSLSYTIGDFTKDLLIFLNVQPSWSFWTSELLALIVFIALINFIINWSFNNYQIISDNILKYFVLSFLIYFAIQIVQIVYPSIKTIFESEINSDSVITYYKYLRTNYTLYIIQSILYYLGEIIAIILIYNKAKKNE